MQVVFWSWDDFASFFLCDQVRFASHERTIFFLLFSVVSLSLSLVAPDNQLALRPSLEKLEAMTWMSGPCQPAPAPTPEERELTASSRSHTREEAWQSKDIPGSTTLNRPTTRSVTASAAATATSKSSTLGKRRALDAELDKENQVNARPLTRSVTAARPRKQAKLSEEVKPWVHKWIDYSTKYGLAFQLSDGCMGVFFNDNSKVVTTPELGSVQYLEAEGKEVEFMTAEQYPKHMKKKVELLKYFRDHFLVGAPLDTLPGPIRVHDGKEPLPLVSSWRHTRSAMVFDIDQGTTLQVNFFDHSKMFLFPKQSSLRFVDRVRNVHFHDLRHKLVCLSASRRLTYLQRVFTTRYPNLNYEMADEAE
jgi:POLO box duplicated region